MLDDEQQSAAHIACRLAMKAWEQGHRVMVLTADEREAASLDEVMWDFPAGRFLPHARASAGSDTPVSIDVHGARIPEGRDVVINLSDQPVMETGRFRRLLEIVPCAEPQRLASRRKFRVYRETGLEPVTHHIEK